MARVLRAEQDARAAVAAAHEEAAHIAERARTEARALAERRRVRLARLHERIERSLATELAAIAAEARALPDQAAPDALALGALQRSVQALATDLTRAAGVELTA
jgi:hypothetical protein